MEYFLETISPFACWAHELGFLFRFANRDKDIKFVLGKQFEVATMVQRFTKCEELNSIRAKAFEIGAEIQGEEMGCSQKILEEIRVDRAEHGLQNYPIIGYGQGMLHQFEYSLKAEEEAEMRAFEEAVGREL